MAAIAFPTVVQTIDYIRLDAAAAEKERDCSVLLDEARHHCGSQTGVVYSFQPELSELSAIAARSIIAKRVSNAGVTVSAPMSKWIESLAGPVQGDPAEGAFFDRFPEVFQYHLKRLAVFPLRAGSELLGLLTLGRAEERSFDDDGITAGLRAARSLTAVLERDSLRHKLLETKVVERAKGILQERRRLTENQAYRTLLDDSRRRRIPMAARAQEIIELYTEPYTPGRPRAN